MPRRRSWRGKRCGRLTAAVVEHLQEWDPQFAQLLAKMTANPWSNAILPRKTVELVGLAVNAACTNLNPDGTRQHMRGALDAGATCDEILMILKMASLLSIHTCSLAAPILLEEAKAGGREAHAEAGDGDSRLRQDESSGPVECGLESVFELTGCVQCKLRNALWQLGR